MELGWLSRAAEQLAQTLEGQSILNAFLGVRWQDTPLGPYQSWPHHIRSQVLLCFQLDNPTAVYLGPELNMIYNAASIAPYHERHPLMFGKSLEAAFADLVNAEETLAAIRSSTKTRKNGYFPTSEMRLLKTHSGIDAAHDAGEVIFASWTVIPLMDEMGECCGVQSTLTDDTHRVIVDARDNIIRSLEKVGAERGVRKLEKLSPGIVQAFHKDKVLVPMIMLFQKSDLSSYSCAMQVGSTVKESGIFDVATNRSTTQLERFMSQACLQRQSVIFTEPIENCAGRFQRQRSDRVKVTPVYASAEDLYPKWILIVSRNSLINQGLRLESYNLALEDIERAFSAFFQEMINAAALELSELRFQQIVELLPMGISIEDRNTRKLSYVNPRWCEVFDIKKEQGLVTTEQESVDLVERALAVMEDKSRIRCNQFYSNLGDGQALHLKTVDCQITGTEKSKNTEDESWIKVNVSYLGTENNEIIGTLVDVSDNYNTARKAEMMKEIQAAASMDRTRAELAEQQTASHLNFIDYFAHELRNPLGAIFHSTELASHELSGMKEAGTGDKVRSHLKTIELCSAHMRRITDDTLVLGQLQNGKLSICKDAVDVPELFRSVLDMFANECESKNIALSLDTSAWMTPDLEVLSDRNRLSQILVNLVTNSMKFAPKSRPGIITIELLSKVSGLKGEVTFKVVDNGIALTDQEISKLFRKFEQASEKTHVQYGGSGLGLSICKTLAECLDGRITASRNDIEGSTFTVSMRVDFCHAQHPDEVSNGAGNNGSISKKVTRSEHTILVVEDNLVNQRLVQKKLQLAGYQVVVASDGEKGFEAITSPVKNAPVDLCLCDIEMPILSGFGCVEKVYKYQRQHSIPLTPFIAMTANARPAQVVRHKAAGMIDTISKPFKFDELIRIVDSYFE